MEIIDKEFLESCAVIDHQNKSQSIIDINKTYGLIAEGTISKLVDDYYDSKKSDDDDSGSQKKLIVGNKKKVDGVTAKLIASDAKSNINRLKRKPQGVIITDTYNHPLFPIREPRIDTARFNLPIITKVFKEYTGVKLDFLPWHFVIEYIDTKYYIFNTRPIDFKFPVTTVEAEQIMIKNDVKMNAHTAKFFEKKHGLVFLTGHYVFVKQHVILSRHSPQNRASLSLTHPVRDRWVQRGSTSFLS